MEKKKRKNEFAHVCAILFYPAHLIMRLVEYIVDKEIGMYLYGVVSFAGICRIIYDVHSIIVRDDDKISKIIDTTACVMIWIIIIGFIGAVGVWLWNILMFILSILVVPFEMIYVRAYNSYVMSGGDGWEQTVTFDHGPDEDTRTWNQTAGTQQTQQEQKTFKDDFSERIKEAYEKGFQSGRQQGYSQGTQEERRRSEYSRSTSSQGLSEIEKARELFMLDPNYTNEELKKQYHRLMKMYHPDNGETDEKYVKKITDAYKLLKK